jgi:restriction system protein
VAIPDFQTLMLPLLRQLADGREHAFADLVEALSEEFDVTPSERRQLLPSGGYPVMRNRVGWARTYLRKAELIESTRRGYCRITERGGSVFAEGPGRIDISFLQRFPEFRKFRAHRHDRPTPDESATRTLDASAIETPEEAMEEAHQRLREDLEAELLLQVQSCSPSFFERLVVELLVQMGYGGTLRDAGQAVGRSGDGGIDGIIKEDRLGLDLIYLQAKRWEGTVGRPEIQRFAGALQGHRARKGVFITTSEFTREAEDYVKAIDPKLVLIDGSTLARLMIDHGVGVSTERSYEVKKIDSDYFSEE